MLDEAKLNAFIIRHTLAGGSVDKELANRIVRLLNAQDDDLVGQIAKRYALIEKTGLDRGPATTKRLEDLLEATRAINSQVYAKVAAGVTLDLTELAKREAEFTARAVKASGGKVDLSALPTPQFLRTLVETTPIPVDQNGAALLKPWIKGMEDARFRRLEGAVRLGLANGEATDGLVSRIRGTKAANYSDGILDVSRRSAQTFAITANGSVQNAARVETFRQMKTIRYVEWSSILDTRTSSICQSRSGTIYNLDEPHPTPPAHPRCRSLLLPRRNNTDAPKHKPFGEWLRDQPEDVQDEVMGKERAAIFRANPKADFSKFFREDGSYRSNAELRQFDDRMFARAEAAQPRPAPRPDPAPEPASSPTRNRPTIDTAALDTEARDYVMEKGRATGNEHLVCYDQKTGKRVEQKEGDRSSVTFTPELIALLSDRKNEIVLHHNHPRSSSLSLPDMIVATQRPGAKGIWAHGHNGSAFYAERGAKKFSEKAAKAMANAVHAKLQALVTAGIVTVADAMLIDNHLVWLALNDLAQITYRADLQGESLAAFNRNKVIYERLLESLK